MSHFLPGIVITTQIPPLHPQLRSFVRLIFPSSDENRSVGEGGCLFPRLFAVLNLIGAGQSAIDGDCCFGDSSCCNPLAVNYPRVHPTTSTHDPPCHLRHRCACPECGPILLTAFALLFLIYFDSISLPEGILRVSQGALCAFKQSECHIGKECPHKFVPPGTQESIHMRRKDAAPLAGFSVSDSLCLGLGEINYTSHHGVSSN